jgi:hypothetical protein
MDEVYTLVNARVKKVHDLYHLLKSRQDSDDE